MTTETAGACPKCGYRRKETDAAPAWQCPACGIAVSKYQPSLAQAKDLEAAIVVFPDLPPRRALQYRVLTAAPDAAMAGLFLWCWIAPTAWRTTLASELGLLMLMEFFALHSGMFLGGAASVQRESLSIRLTTAMVVMAVYVPVAGGFAYFHGGWSPFLGFAWLLLTRVIAMLAGQGSGKLESQRQRFYWGASGGYYILCYVAALILPLPQLGLGNAPGMFWDTWWVAKPHVIIPWGFLYFGTMAVIKLWEKPEWIEEMKEPA